MEFEGNLAVLLVGYLDRIVGCWPDPTTRWPDSGYMFLGEVCRELGISAKAYWRLEAAGKVPEAERRKGIGGTMVRVFKKRDLARLKMMLDSRRPSPLTEDRGRE
jgi:hypothetical protein